MSLVSVALLLAAAPPLPAATALSPLNAGALLPLWPLPKSVISNSSKVLVRRIDQAFSISNVGAMAQGNIVIARAIQRYEALVRGTVPSIGGRCNSAPAAGTAVITQLIVAVASNISSLVGSPDESYKLRVPVEGPAVLSAPSVFGALRGMETFSQLVASNHGTLVACSGVNISDSPRFTHRELLVDTARYYFPASAMLHILDAMAYSKLNVLHWHLIDGQSFSLESSTYPELSKAGAFRPGTIGCGATRCTYSAADVAQVVDHGLDRGIRVVPEFDTPGHAKSWGDAYPNVTVRGCSANADLTPLNPIEPFAAELVKGVLDEFMAPGGTFRRSGADRVHLGGDEVHTVCYENRAFCRDCDRIASYLSAHNLSAAALVDQWHHAVHGWSTALSLTPIVWEEAFTMSADGGASLAPNAVVQIWKEEGAALQPTAAAGREVLLSAGWYVHSSSKVEDFYSIEPFHLDGNWTDEQRLKVLGGGVSKWGCSGFCPFPTTPHNFDSKVWPLACAVAERLWSPYEATASFADAEERIAVHRERLLARGVDAGKLHGAR